MITVFTPTYNRAHLLPRLYESLCRQTFTDFEWVIVDDGSTDGTKDLFHPNGNGKCFLAEIAEKTTDYTGLTDNKSLAGNTEIAENQIPIFPIRYFYQENGGKHRAINRGVKEAKGELFLILDSDDSLPPEALERINLYYQQIREDNSFGGVCGYMAHHDGTVIGHGNDATILDTNSIALRHKYHVQGDMCEVFRTSVLREIPFPEIHGEKFVPEALVWNRIAKKYRLRVFHEVVYYRDYLDGGLTDKIVKIRMNSPVASMMTYAEMTQYDIPFIQKVKAAINYYRFKFCLSLKDKKPSDVSIHWIWAWTIPLGWLMHFKDKQNFQFLI